MTMPFNLKAPLGLDFSRNYSFFTVPAALATTLVPHLYAVVLAGRKYDNRHPRALKESVATAKRFDERKKSRILRAKAASENGFETLGFFSAAVVAANQAGVDARLLNALGVGYVVSRAAYDLVYIRGDESRQLSQARTALWGAGLVATLALWVAAGLKVSRVATRFTKSGYF